MKFEKLNKDKMRVTLSRDDLEANDIDFHSFMSDSHETETLFLAVLDKAEQPINLGDATKIKSLSIANDGTINFLIDGNDALQEKGPIGIARFNNNGGLEKIGDNLYKNTVNSGEAVPLTPGVNGAGILVSGTLEMSNVDLSEEFTEMITAQRGFQANTRIITTSDEILQELVNLKR